VESNSLFKEKKKNLNKIFQTGNSQKKQPRAKKWGGDEKTK